MQVAETFLRGERPDTAGRGAAGKYLVGIAAEDSGPRRALVDCGGADDSVSLHGAMTEAAEAAGVGYGHRSIPRWSNLANIHCRTVTNYAVSSLKG